jgi:hypothetical protein
MTGVGLFFLALAIGLGLAYAGSTPAEKPRGMKIEVRNCRPISSPTEATETTNCSCTVSEWIDDHDDKILVCEH